MRIHHVSPQTTGQVWQVVGCGVRRVLIADKPLPCVFAVCRQFGPPIQTAAGVVRGFGYRRTHVAITDLFATEQDARLESLARRVVLRDPVDIRRLRNIPLADATLSTVALGLGLLMGSF